jgi:shikimate kinase
MIINNNSIGFNNMIIGNSGIGKLSIVRLCANITKYNFVDYGKEFNNYSN